MSYPPPSWSVSEVLGSHGSVGWGHPLQSFFSPTILAPLTSSLLPPSILAPTTPTFLPSSLLSSLGCPMDNPQRHTTSMTYYPLPAMWPMHTAWTGTGGQSLPRHGALGREGTALWAPQVTVLSTVMAGVCHV